MRGHKLTAEINRQICNSGGSQDAKVDFGAQPCMES